MGGELQGALGAVPALPAELELALLHPAVRPGRHAARVRQVSLAWETAALKSTLFEPLSVKTHEQVVSPFPLYLAGLGADTLWKVWFLGKYYFPFAKQNNSI